MKYFVTNVSEEIMSKRAKNVNGAKNLTWLKPWIRDDKIWKNSSVPPPPLTYTEKKKKVGDISQFSNTGDKVGKQMEEILIKECLWVLKKYF